MPTPIVFYSNMNTLHPLCPCHYSKASVFKGAFWGARNAEKYLKFHIIMLCALKNMKVGNISYYFVFWMVWSEHCFDCQDVDFKYMKTKCWWPNNVTVNPLYTTSHYPIGSDIPCVLSCPWNCCLLYLYSVCVRVRARWTWTLTSLV
jgi:hypothetical protein